MWINLKITVTANKAKYNFVKLQNIGGPREVTTEGRAPQSAYVPKVLDFTQF